MKQIDKNFLKQFCYQKCKTTLLGTMLTLLGLTGLNQQSIAQTVMTESFSTTSLPTGWTSTTDGSTSASASWKFTGSPGYGASTSINGRTTGTYAWVDASSPYTNVHAVTLTSPSIDLSGLSEPIVQFEWFKSHSSTSTLPPVLPTQYTSNLLTIEVKETSGSTWTTIFSDSSNNTSWRTEMIPIPASFLNATIQVRFVVDKDVNGEGYFYDDLLLDEVKVKQAPTCFPPTDLLVDLVGANSVDLTWTAPTTAPPASYEYYWSTNATAPLPTTTPTGTGLTGTSGTVSGFSPNTTYNIWIRSACSPSDKSDWSSMATFTTLCMAFPAPWLDDVEAAAATTNAALIEDCWSATPATGYGWNIDGSGSTPSTGTGPSGAYSGSNYFYIESGDGSVGDIAELTTPQIDVATLTTPALKFYYHMYGTSTGDLYIEAFDGTSWNTVDSIKGQQQLADSEPWLSKLIPLPGYTGNIQIRFKAIKTITGFVGDISLDDIQVMENPSCFPPTGLTVDMFTQNSANISWTAPSQVPGSGYEYYYNTTGTTPTPTTPASGVVATGTTATINTLTPNTTYTVWVRSVCSATEKSNWSNSAEFTTSCAAVMAPLIEDLDGGALPSCWTNTTDGSGTNANLFWKFTGTPGYGVSSPGRPSGTYAWIDASVPYENVHAVTLTSPPIDLTGITAPYVQFDWLKDNDNLSFDNNKLTVEVKETSSATWVQIFSDDSNDPDWRVEGIELPASFINTTIQVRFVADKDVSGNGNFYDDLLIDNIQVKEMPVCAIPTALSTTTLTENSADVTWTSDATADHLVEYGLSGFAPGSGTLVEVSGNSTLLSTLDPNTTYDYYVQLICDDGVVDTSAYSAVGTFTTLCNEVLIPLDDTTMLCAASSVILDAGTDGVAYLWSDNSTDQTLEVSAPGSYTVEVTNTYGCIGIDTVIVEQLPPIVVDLGEDFSICEGSEAVTLDAGNPGNTYQWSNTAVSQTIEVNAEGTYTVVVTDEFGCEGTDSIVVTILQAPVTNGITAVYQPDNSYDFFAVATTNAETYLWDFGDGNTSNLEAPNHTYANSGNYTVSLTITNNCGEDTTSVRIQAHGTGIQQITLDEHQFRVYPNPAEHVLHIENNSNYRMQEVVVYNILGQVVYQAEVDQAKHYQFNVSSFSSGIYQIRIQMEEGYLSRKFEVIK